jgi:hypothetical protein
VFPFHVYINKLIVLKESSILPHHLVIDAMRVLEDCLVQSVVTFAAKSAIEKAAPTIADSLKNVTDQLIDEDILTLSERQQVAAFRALRDSLICSSAREVPPATAAALLDTVMQLVHRFAADFRKAVISSASSVLLANDGGEGNGDVSVSACPAEHRFCRKASTVDFDGVHASQLPHGWSHADFEAHQAPLHNTQALELPLAFDDAVADDDDDVDEGEESEYNVDADDSDYDEDEAAARVSRAAARAQRRQRRAAFTPFSFCCVTCHQTLLDTQSVHRIVANQVWSKPESDGLQRWLETDLADAWTSPFKAFSVANDERVVAGESVGVRCNRCHAYVGRYFSALDQYRLVYINKRTGENWLYYTGDAGIDALPPATIADVGDDEDGGGGGGGGGGDDGELERAYVYQTRRQAAGTPSPRFGIELDSLLRSRPGAKVGVRGGDAAGLPLSADYDADAEAAAIQAERKAARALLGRVDEGYGSDGGDSDEDSDEDGDSVGRGRPKVPLADEHRGGQLHQQATSARNIIARMARGGAGDADPEYALASDEATAAQDIRTLLLTDRAFAARRSIDTINDKVRALFSHWPVPPYTQKHNPVVPAYVPFFVQPPMMTHCIGTARYVYHYLTGRDVVAQPQKKYTLQRMRTLLRNKQRKKKQHNMCVHVTVGNEARGHRFCIVKIGQQCRVYQSNACTRDATDAFTLLDWLGAASPWNRTLSLDEALAFIGYFDQAVRGNETAWEELFCCGGAAGDYDAGWVMTRTGGDNDGGDGGDGDEGGDGDDDDDVGGVRISNTIRYSFAAVTDDFFLLPRNQLRYESSL